MLSKKLQKLVYFLSENGRIRTKELGKELKISQQSASYLISSLKEKGTIISNSAIIDPAKIGAIGILVYYNFTEFSNRVVQEIIKFLEQEESIVSIEQFESGYDLACIYRVQNLSQFNKINKDFLQTFRDSILVVDKFPIVARHIFSKKYLTPKKKKQSWIVISGDRDIANMTKNEKRVIKLFLEDSNNSLIEIARKLNINPKTVIKVKNNLEKKNIIRGYTTIWNFDSLEIDRKKILIYSEDLDIDESDDLINFAALHPNITEFTRLIGDYDIQITVEGENITRREVIKELRERGIKKFKIINSGRIYKEKYISSNFFD